MAVSIYAKDTNQKIVTDWLWGTDNPRQFVRINYGGKYEYRGEKPCPKVGDRIKGITIEDGAIVDYELEDGS